MRLANHPQRGHLMLKSFKQFVREPEKEEKPFFYWANAKLKHSKYPYSPDNEENKIELSDFEKEQEAKRKTTSLKEAIHDLSVHLLPHEENSLREYTSSTSHRINHLLHDKYHEKKLVHSNYMHDIPELETHIANMDAAFANPKNRVKGNHVVYSGVPESPAKLFKLEKARLKLKDTDPDPPVHAHLPAFTSTTTIKELAKDFAMRKNGVSHILKIHVPKGHPSISVRGLSHYPDEDEVLLHRGTRLRIDPKPQVSKVGWDLTHIWTAHVVGHNPNSTISDLNSVLGNGKAKAKPAEDMIKSAGKKLVKAEKPPKNFHKDESDHVPW